MTRRAWALFAALSVIWGMPYLFIKIAVEEVPPAALVGLRTALAAAVLLPLALRARAVGPALRRWRPLLAFAALEIAGPWLLLGRAEQSLPSGLTGLLVAATPLVGTAVTAGLGDAAARDRGRLAGLAVGLAGVAAIVGLDWLHGGVDLAAAGMVGVVAVCYAVAPIIADRRLAGVPSVGVSAVALAVVAVGYLPATLAQAPRAMPPPRVVVAVAVLGLVCTALAFMVFFALIAEAGPVRATVITFVNPAVAVLLGLVVLGEPLTVGTVVGFPLVLAGSWLATRPAAARAAPPEEADDARPARAPVPEP